MIGPYALEPGVVNGGIESATSSLVPALAERVDIDSVTVMRFDHDPGGPRRRGGCGSATSSGARSARRWPGPADEDQRLAREPVSDLTWATLR